MRRDLRSPCELFLSYFDPEAYFWIQTFTGDNLTKLIKKLVDIDSAWIPTDPGTSLCPSAPLPFVRPEPDFLQTSALP